MFTAARQTTEMCGWAYNHNLQTYGGAQEEKIRMSAFEMSVNIHLPPMAPDGCSIE